MADIAPTVHTTAGLSTRLSGTLDHLGDHDWFRINLTAGTTYRFWLRGADSNAGTVADPFLQLMDSWGGLLLQDDDGGTGRDSLISFRATTSGTYYLDASGSGISGTYTIGITRLIPDVPGTTASTTTLGIGRSRTSKIDRNGDSDWFKVTLQQGESYRFSLRGYASSGGTLRDPYLQIRSSTGRVLGSNDDGGRGADSRLVFTAQRSGTYFVSAGEFGNNATGTYTISAAQMDPAANGRTWARIRPGSSVLGRIGVAGDKDFYKVSLTAETAYWFDLRGRDSRGGTLANPTVALYNSAGNFVTWNDDAGTGRDARIHFVAPTTGTYYLGAASTTTRGTGSFTLSASIA